MQRGQCPGLRTRLGAGRAFLACGEANAGGPCAAALLAARGVPHAERVAYDADGLTAASYDDPGGIRGRLRATARDFGLTPAAQGYGLVDAAAAVASVDETLAGERGVLRTDQPAAPAWHSLAFRGSYADPVALRYRNLTPTGVEVFVEEERSADPETNHFAETVGHLVFEGSGPL